MGFGLHLRREPHTERHTSDIDHIRAGQLVCEAIRRACEPLDDPNRLTQQSEGGKSATENLHANLHRAEKRV
jgi:hypothetical protein